ncbi:DNA-3-methyladenine glycosylase [Nocardioides sp. ChNu-99]|uniref:DNA-3-methyladenine glycosylase n=1 Tax=Nocardioides sp. ChNu-99 TaxID=2839897 RepID=UPI0024051E1C|nr:DNA-3-methyladenine glycosylase [Nocardioides sp. ChNu-99]MDF9717238.1 DNA-3-methyladenine glycosylase [Nocardioides sp. ChNu-99]
MSDLPDLHHLLGGPVEEVAPSLLGLHVVHGEVRLRLTEVEAYDGERDPASHAWRGRTARNAAMFGPRGHAYVYFTYGMHYCLNVVTGDEGTASGVLLRAGEVVAGTEVARARRPGAPPRDLARGPARLTKALGVDANQYGVPLLDPAGELRLERAGDTPGPELVSSGPRVGVSREAERPWRFWLTGDPTVSPYRPAVKRRR